MLLLIIRVHDTKWKLFSDDQMSENATRKDQMTVRINTLSYTRISRNVYCILCEFVLCHCPGDNLTSLLTVCTKWNISFIKFIVCVVYNPRPTSRKINPKNVGHSSYSIVRRVYTCQSFTLSIYDRPYDSEVKTEEQKKWHNRNGKWLFENHSFQRFIINPFFIIRNCSSICASLCLRIIGIIGMNKS